MIDSIEFDRERKGYKFMNGDCLKKLILSDEEFLLLLVMSETVSHLGEPFKEEFRKLTESIMNIKKTIPDKRIFPIVVKIPDAIITERLNGYFKTISDCIREKRSIEIIYKALHSKEVTTREVDPYGLVFYQGTWTLIGYCHLRNKVRHFDIDRINGLRERWHYFRGDFDIEGHLSLSWGIYDDDAVDVKVRFDKKVAEYITRRDKWHQSEKRTILPSGDVELSFTVAGVDEIKRWIYSWIPDVEVIKPQWLRKQVKRELAGTLKGHP
jgi:predicted DNA-binding transcriptional regulator YafY